MADDPVSLDIVQSIEEDMEYIDDGLKEAEQVLKTLETYDYDDIVEKLSPLDRAKYDLTVLYSINSCYWNYLKSFGDDPKAHPIMEEMERIKKIRERIKVLTTMTDNSTPSSSSRTLVVDAKAAHRMVKHELWEPQKKQAKLQNTSVQNNDVQEEDWDNKAAESAEAPDDEISSDDDEES